MAGHHSPAAGRANPLRAFVGAIVALAAAPFLPAQYQVEWANQYIGGGLPGVATPANDGIEAVATDSRGNIYALLSFQHTIQVGGAIFTNFLPHAGESSYDTLFMKWTPDGTLVATRHFDTGRHSLALGMHISPGDHIFAWVIREPLPPDYGANPPPVTLFQLDEDGNTIWERDFQTAPGSLAASEDGRLLAAFEIVANFDEANGWTPRSHRFGAFEFVVERSPDTALVKIGTNGAILHSEVIPSSATLYEGRPQLAYGGGGRFILAGIYNFDITLAGQTFTGTVVNLPGGEFLRPSMHYLAGYDWNAGFVWARHLGAYNDTFVAKFVSPRPGIAYFLSTFEESFQLENHSFTASGEDPESVITKWDGDGNLLEAGHITDIPRLFPPSKLAAGNTGAIYFEDYISAGEGAQLPDGQPVPEPGSFYFLEVGEDGSVRTALPFFNGIRGGYAVDPGGNIILAGDVFLSVEIAGVRLRSRGVNARTTATILKLGPGNQGPPYLVRQPQAPAARRGQSARLAVTARGTQPLGYQWQKDGVDISGATGATLTIPAVGSAEQGEYRVVVGNALGSITSALAGVHLPPERNQVTVEWARHFGYSTSESVTALDTDASGNVYFTGAMEDVIQLGAEAVFGTVFVAKVGPDGEWLWRFGNRPDGEESDEVRSYGLAVGEDGDVYVCGAFEGDARFGPIRLNARGGRDAFVARISPTGLIRWVKSLGGEGNGEEAIDLAPAPGGGVCVVGHFTSSGGEFGNATLTSSGKFDVFACQLAPDGDVLWAQSYGGSETEFASKIGYQSSSGKVFIAGTYFGAFTFGPRQLQPGPIGVNHFLGELDASNGNPLEATAWTNWRTGGISGLEPNRGPGGGIFVGGSFTDSMTYLGTTLTDVFAGGADFRRGDGFLALDAPGAGGDWVRQIVGPDHASVGAFGADATGNVYAAGSFLEGVEFAPGMGQTITAAGPKRFVAKYDADGDIRWFHAMTGTGAFALTTAAAGDGDSIVVGGSFSGSVQLGTEQLAAFEIDPASPDFRADALVFKIGAVPLPPLFLTKHPANVSLPAGGTSVLSAEASEPSVTWQWFEGARGDASNPIPGATSNAYATPPGAAVRRYWVRITSPGGDQVDSAAATVIPVPPPVFTEQPADQTIAPNTATTLTADAAGPGLSYQWFEVSPGLPVEPLSFGNRACLVTPLILTPRSYWVRATDYLGQSTNSRTATVTPDGAIPAIRFQTWKDDPATGFSDGERASPTFDTDDLDGDGLGNLLEYALGLDPKSADGSGLEAVQGQERGSHVVISFPRLRADLTYRIEVSKDGLFWMRFTTNPGNVGDVVTVAVPIDSTDMLVRLRVSRP